MALVMIAKEGGRTGGCKNVIKDFVGCCLIFGREEVEIGRGVVGDKVFDFFNCYLCCGRRGCWGDNDYVDVLLMGSRSALCSLERVSWSLRERRLEVDR